MERLFRFFLPADISLRWRRLELMGFAFLMSLATYPESFGFLAWIALIRPFMIIASLPSAQAFRSAYFFGFCFTAFSVYWIALVTPPGTVGAVMLVASYYAIALWLFNRVYHYHKILGLILLPFLWVGVEHYRTLTEFAFPWSDLGYTQSYYLEIMQIVSIISVHGLSLLIVTVNILLWQFFRPDLRWSYRYTCFLVPLGLVSFLWAYGWAIIPIHPTEGDLSVSVLQGSISLEEKWARNNAGYTFDIYAGLIDSIDDPNINLYIWPETVLPCYLARDNFCRDRMSKIARSSEAFHLVGTLSARAINNETRHFNSCFQIDPQGDIGQLQEKVKLVPFSEQVPYQDYVPFLRPDRIREYLSFIETYDVQWWSDFYAGDSAVVFETDQTKYGVLICFESTFPEYSRQMILDGARFLVGITNDTWFGRSVGIHQHARIFVTRAIENRCWGVRAANTGLSYVVDDYGRIRQNLPIYEKGAFVANIAEISGFSLFTRVGDIAGKASFLILCVTWIILALSWLRKKIIKKS